LQFIAVVANCNAKRVPRQKHCSAVHCNELYAIAAPLQSPQAPRLLRTRVGHCSRELGPVLIFSFAFVRLVGSTRLYPARAAAVTAGTEALREDAVAKVARPLLNCANVRGATANLELTFHSDHSVGANHVQFVLAAQGSSRVCRIGRCTICAVPHAR